MKAVAESRTNAWSDTTKLILNHSFLIAITYTVIFAIAKIFNLEGVVELRFLNYVMMFVIAYSAMKKLYVMNGEKMEYFSGLSRTFLICALGNLWYCILFFIYLHIDRSFADQLVHQFNTKMLAPMFSITAVLFSEGLAIGSIVALALMQIFKRKRGRWARM